MANDWFEFGHGQERLASGPRYLVEPEPAADEFEAQSEEAKDAVEVSAGSRSPISVKIQRALHGLEREALDPDFWEDMPRTPTAPPRSPSSPSTAPPAPGRR